MPRHCRLKVIHGYFAVIETASDQRIWTGQKRHGVASRPNRRPDSRDSEPDGTSQNAQKGPFQPPRTPGHGQPAPSPAGLPQGQNAGRLRGNYCPAGHSKVVMKSVAIPAGTATLSLLVSCLAVWQFSSDTGHPSSWMLTACPNNDCWLSFCLLTAAAGLSRSAATWGDFGVVGNCRRCYRRR